MPHTLSCPESHDLRRFLLGQLATPDADDLEQHLLHCHRCQGSVPVLAAEDAVVAAMRGQAVGEEPEKDIVESLINRVQQLQRNTDGAAEDTEPQSGQGAAARRPSMEKVWDAQTTLDDPVLAGRATRTVEWPGVGANPPTWQQHKPATVAGAPAAVSVPGYEILGELGRGGMGVVYRARQVSLNRLVALKMILSGDHAGVGQRARFRAEAEVVARLQHPHIVQIYEINEHEGRPYLALEFIAGGNLVQRLKNTPQNARASAQLVETLARAMHAAHERGIIHRDLKPANVLLVRSDRPQAVPLGSPDESGQVDRYEPKITDFGLARQLDRAPGHSESGLVVGTPSYMSPEQAQAKTREIGPPADIYALGAILYDLLAGRPPFKAENPVDTVTQVIHYDPVPPSRLQPTVPRDLETICLKCLQKEPQRRYHSAQALADDLCRFLAGEPIQARPVGVWERGAKWARRRPVVAALVSVSVLAALSLVMIAVVYGAYQGQRARVAQQAASLLQKELDNDRQFMDIQRTVQEYLGRGQIALAKGDLQNSRIEFTKALTRIGSEARLRESKAEAERLLGEVNSELAKLDARERAGRNLTQFREWRDKALFSESRLGSLDAGFNQKATRNAALEALKLFGITPGTRTRLIPDVQYSDEQNKEFSAGCYTLLLILAEAVAQPLESENRRQQIEEARQILEQAALLRPATRAYHQRLARYLAQLGRQAEADKEDKKAKALKPEEAVDYFLLGDEAYQRRDWRQAIAYFKSALRSEPKHFWARFLAAIAYMQLRQPDKAEIYLSVCQSEQPEFAWIYIVRGFAYGQLGDHAAAEKDFGEALKALKQKPNEEATYNLLVNRGATRIQHEKYAEAIADLNEAVQLEPKYFHAYLNLAKAYEEQEEYEEAVAQLNRAIEREEKLPILYHARGMLHLELEDLPRALADFDKAIRLYGAGGPAATEPEVLAEDHHQRGRILHQQGHYDDALTAYNEALKILPDHSLTLRFRGTLLFEQKHYEEAIKDFDAYLKKWRSAPEMYAARGLARTALRDYDGAIVDYTQALTLQPTSERYALRAWIHIFREAPRQALQDFEQALKLDRKNGDAFAGRGYAHIRLGHVKEAVADADEALRHGQPTAEQTKRHLYNVARIFAQAAGQVKVDERQPYRQTLEKRSFYQDRALGLIRKALGPLSEDQRGAFWRNYIQEDATFNPIRRSNEFAQLAEKYSRPSK